MRTMGIMVISTQRASDKLLVLLVLMVWVKVS